MRQVSRSSSDLHRIVNQAQTLSGADAGQFFRLGSSSSTTAKSADLVIALTEQVIARDQLTTLMVTHSMHQAASLGDRLIMMHRGQIIHDFQGAAKRRLRPDDLLARFEEVRRAEQLDESAAQMLAEQYV